MADAISTLKLTVDTGGAVEGLKALTESLERLKTGLLQLDKVDGNMARLQAEVEKLRGELRQWQDGTKNATQQAETSFKNLAGTVSGSAGSMRVSLKQTLDNLDETHLGFQKLKKIGEEGQRAFAQGFDRGEWAKGYALQLKQTSEKLTEFEAAVKRVRQAKSEMTAGTELGTLTKEYGLGIEKLILDLPNLEAKLLSMKAAIQNAQISSPSMNRAFDDASLENARRNLQAWNLLHAEQYVAESKAAENLLALKERTRSQLKAEQEAELSDARKAAEKAAAERALNAQISSPGMNRAVDQASLENARRNLQAWNLIHAEQAAAEAQAAANLLTLKERTRSQLKAEQEAELADARKAAEKAAAERALNAQVSSPTMNRAYDQASLENARRNLQAWNLIHAEEQAAESQAAANLIALKERTRSQLKAEQEAELADIKRHQAALKQMDRSLDQSGRAEARFAARQMVADLRFNNPNLSGVDLLRKQVSILREVELLASKGADGVALAIERYGLAAVRALGPLGNLERALHNVEQRQRQVQEVVKNAQFDLKGLNFNAQGRDVFVASALVNAGFMKEAREMFGPKVLSEIANLGAAHYQAAGHVANHTQNTKLWVNAANEAHSAARGLAGGLNMLWVTWGSMAPLVAGAALTGTMRSLVEEGKKVEYQLAFLKGLSEGTETVSVGQLEGAIQGSLVTAQQGAEGLRALMQSGLSAKDALSSLPEVLRLATVGEVSVSEAAFAATGVMKAFGMSINEIGMVSDVMAKSAAASNASVSDMMQAFKYASAAAARYGATLEETGAALAVLSEKNIKGSMAGTAHMNMLRELYTPTARAGEAFKKLGLDMQEMQRQGLNTVQMLEAIRTRTASLDSTSLRSFADAIGGERGGRELAPLLAGSTKALSQMQEKLEESKGFTKRVMAELADTVEGAMARVKQAWGTTLSAAFQEAQGPLQVFLDTLANGLRSDAAVNFFRRLADGLVNLTRTVSDHIVLIGVLLYTYAGFKTLLTLASLLEGMSQKWQKLSLATTANTAATMANTEAQAANAAVQAGAAASGLARVATGLSLVSTGIGAILAIGGALWAFWDLFVAKTDKGRSSIESFNNRMKETGDLLDREIDRLKERNRLRAEGKDPDKATPADSIELRQKEAVSRLDTYLQAQNKPERYVRSANGDLIPNAKGTLQRYTVTLEDGTETKLTRTELAKAINDLRTQIATNIGRIDTHRQQDRQASAGDAAQLLESELQDRIDRLYDRRGLTENKDKIGKIDEAIATLEAYKKAELATPNDARKVLRGLQPVADTAGDHMNFQARNDHGGEMRAEFQAEKAAIMEMYRDKERLAKTEYDSEKKLTNTLYQDKLISDAEFNNQRLFNERFYDETVKQAGDQAKRDLEALGKKYGENATNSMLLELRNEKIKIDHRNAEQAWMDAINKAEQTRLSLIRQQADSRKFREQELPKAAAHFKAKWKKADELRDADLKSPEDAAADAAREDVVAHYQQLMSVREQSLAQVTKELDAQEKLDKQYNRCSEATLHLRDEQQLLKDDLAKATEEMWLQADSAAAAARGLEQYHRSAEFGTKKAFATFRNNATDGAKQAEELWTGALNQMSDALTQFVMTGKLSFKGLVDYIGQQLTRIAINQIISSMLPGSVSGGGSSEGLFGSLIGAAISWWGGTPTTSSTPSTVPGWQGTTTLGNGIHQAKGGAYDNAVQAFAKGGSFTNRVISSPTHFRYGSKRDKLGLMGEAGPEAIMPLARTRDGRLGVRMLGGRAGLEQVLPLTRDGAGRLSVTQAANASQFKMFANGGAFGDGDMGTPRLFSSGETFNPAPALMQRPMPSQPAAAAAQTQNTTQHQRPIQVTMNIQTQDANSFRASQGQVLAEMNRALAAGRRNM